MKRSSAPVWLPAFRVSTRRGVPLSDAVTSAICAAILEETGVSSGVLSKRLAAIAERDPSFAVWWVGQGGETFDLGDGCVFAHRPMDDLGWLERLADSLTLIPVKRKLPQKWSHQSLRAVAAARQARCQAARRMPGAEEVAYWGGLLSGAFDCALHGTDLPRRLSARRVPLELLEQLLARAGCELRPRRLNACICRAHRVIGNDPRHEVRRWLEPQERVNGMLQCAPLRALLPQILARALAHQRLEREFLQRLECEKLKSMRELAYGASHEINNPLANISSRAQILLRDEADPERRRSLATIVSQVFRAHEMLADLMLFAKPPELDRQPVDLVDLVRQVVARLDEDSPPEVACRWQSTEPSIQVDADAVQLVVALGAIGRNAVQAMDQGGLLRYQVQRSPQQGKQATSPTWVEVVIQDTGPGLTDRQRHHLFDPFFSGREAGRGLGLGLSKAWRIVQLHGGTIAVHSETRMGTTFTIRLPRLEQTSEPITRRPTEAPSAGESEPAPRERSALQSARRTDPPDAAETAPPPTPERSPPP